MKVVLKDLTKKFPGRIKKEEEVTAVSHFDFEIPDDCWDLPAAERVPRCS